MNIVVEHNCELYSLIVDNIGDVINVPSDTLEQVPPTLDDRWKYLSEGICRLEQGIGSSQS